MKRLDWLKTHADMLIATAGVILVILGIALFPIHYSFRVVLAGAAFIYFSRHINV